MAATVPCKLVKKGVGGSVIPSSKTPARLHPRVDTVCAGGLQATGLYIGHHFTQRHA